MAQSSRPGIIGAIVGDALGVPYEFDPRSQIAYAPAKDMIGYGTYDQPPGTWSDDSSLILCTIQALINGYDLSQIAASFVDWFETGLWTPHGTVFDIGVTTRNVIDRLSEGEDPKYSGEVEEQTNGNGSLMRIIPMAYYLLREQDAGVRYERVAEVSAISHAHVRSKLCCFYYTELARLLMNGAELDSALNAANEILRSTFTVRGIVEYETRNYERLLSGLLGNTHEDEIHSTGYVMHTLEASIWCLLNTSSYSDAVLKAVNLGEDTDTTACVTGALAGIMYGEDAIPDDWLHKIARLDEIESLIDRFDADRLATKR